MIMMGKSIRQIWVKFPQFGILNAVLVKKDSIHTCRKCSDVFYLRECKVSFCSVYVFILSLEIYRQVDIAFVGVF